jgi:hypothetical protein
VVTVGEQVHSPSLLQGRNAVVTKPVPNFTRLDSGRPEIAILMDAMLRAREVVAARLWSSHRSPRPNIGGQMCWQTLARDDAGFRVAFIASAAERWSTERTILSLMSLIR